MEQYTDDHYETSACAGKQFTAEDDDEVFDPLFAFAPPDARPVVRRGRKRKIAKNVFAGMSSSP